MWEGGKGYYEDRRGPRGKALILSDIVWVKELYKNYIEKEHLEGQEENREYSGPEK